MASRPYDDLTQIRGGTNIPMFNQHGTALSQEERENIARKKGICVKCGVKTHDVKMFKRTPLTNDQVYEGICIRCNGSMCPAPVYQAWEQKFKPHQPTVSHHPTGGRFRAAARVAQATRGPPNRSHAPREGAPSNSHDVGGYQHTSHLRPREAARPISSRIDIQDISKSTVMKPSSLENLPGPSSNPISRNTAPVVIGSDAVNEDYTGGNSTEDAWQTVKAIRDNKGKPEILKQKLHRLRNLGDDQTGSLYEIKDVMDQYRNDTRVMAVCSGAVWGVTAQNDDKKTEAASAGALHDIADALRSPAGKRDSDLVQWTSGALACLARGIDNRQEIADAGAIEAILEALQTHSDSPGVFEWSCRALHAFVHQYENEGDEEYTENAAAAIKKNIVTIDDADGISILARAMKNHALEHVAQWWAMKLLWRLLDRTDVAAGKRALQKMVDEGTATTCIKVLKARSTTGRDFEVTASLLYNLLALSGEGTVSEQASDCLLTVVRKMKESPEDEMLQESCCLLLSSIAGGNRLQMKESHGLDAVISSMAQFPQNLTLQRSGCSVLWTLSYIPAFFDMSCMNDAIEAISAARQHHISDADFVANACGFIANAALSHTGNPELPFRIPLQALSMHFDKPHVADQAGRALGNLCMQSPTMVRRVIDANGIQSLVECLGSQSQQVVQAVMGALVAVANTSDECKRTLLSAGCLDSAKKQIQSSSSMGLAEKALELISTTVTTERRSTMQLPGDIFQVIMQSMRTQLTRSESQERACGVMRNLLVVSTPGSTSLNFRGLVDFMTELISDRSGPVALKREACGVIWALTARHNKQNTHDLSRMFRSVLGVMGMYKGDSQSYNSDLQSIATGALASITACFRDNSIHVAAEEVEEIISVMYMVMEYDLDRTELLEKFLDVVLNLSFVNEGIVIQCGGIVVVIDAMVEHEQVETIQERGCSVLALLSSTENLQVNLCIAETDGIDMIVSALAVFPTNQRIQVDACKALSHLSVDHESRMLIASQGGLILVVNAMNSNQENVDLLEGACSALLNLSADAEEQVLADSSVVDSVVALMKYHPDASRLQEKALGVLQNVSMRNANAKQAIAYAGGIGAVTMSMKEYMGSPTVLERAFTTLWSLAVLERNQVEIANAGGIGLVVNGMMANINYDKVQKQACGCLCTLSSNSRNKTLIREAGGVDAIVYAMWAHYDSEVLQIEACRALSSLAVNVQTNEVMIATDGEINAIIAAMRRYPDSSKLQEHACVALRNFMLSSDNANLIRSNAYELRRLMMRAANRFPDKCSERANQVLAGLN